MKRLPDNLALGMQWKLTTGPAGQEMWISQKPSSEFWNKWRADKAAMREQGYTVTKAGTAWVVTFSPPLLPEDEEPIRSIDSPLPSVRPYFDYNLYVPELDNESLRRCALRVIGLQRATEDDKNLACRLLASVSSPRHVVAMARLVAKYHKYVVKNSEEDQLIQSIVNLANNQHSEFLKRYNPREVQAS